MGAACAKSRAAPRIADSRADTQGGEVMASRSPRSGPRRCEAARLQPLGGADELQLPAVHGHVPEVRDRVARRLARRRRYGLPDREGHECDRRPADRQLRSDRTRDAGSGAGGRGCSSAARWPPLFGFMAWVPAERARRTPALIVWIAVSHHRLLHVVLDLRSAPHGARRRDQPRRRRAAIGCSRGARWCASSRRSSPPWSAAVDRAGPGHDPVDVSWSSRS